MRNLIGFNTPSKEQAQEDLNAQTESAPMPQGMEGMNTERLKQETLMRLQQLGDVITSPQYGEYAPQQKQQILMDFAYYSKVADSL